MTTVDPITMTTVWKVSVYMTAVKPPKNNQNVNIRFVRCQLRFDWRRAPDSCSSQDMY